MEISLKMVSKSRKPKYAKVSITDIFGAGWETYLDPQGEQWLFTFDLKHLRNTDDGGTITGGLGLNQLPTDETDFINRHFAEKILYALLLRYAQIQAESVNGDPEQSIFISDGGKGFGTGDRDGQIRRTLAVNVFSNFNLNTLPDIDELGSNSAS